ncbi:AraC family transcriptional regulator [Vibrio cincinnatiensis]|nr:AraC family transcriptional regulator [Vibrio cincinnatiensis]
MIIIRMYVKLSGTDREVECIMQNRTFVMENTQTLNQAIRQTITLSNHSLKEHDEIIIAQHPHQPVMARGRFIKYTSPSGFVLHGGSCHELADCDVMTTGSPALVIILLVEGKLSFAYDDLKFSLCAKTQPQALMVNLQQPCIFHRRLHQGMQVRKLNIILSPDKLNQFAEQDCPLRHFIQQDKAFTHLSLSTNSWQKVGNLLDKSDSHTLSQHIAREATCWSLIQEAIMQCPESDVHSPRVHDNHTECVINNLLHYIDQHLYDEIGLEKLAEQHAMSVSNLQRKFKARLNMTIVHYIRHRRLQLARQQLERGLVSITEAAYEAGYLHPSNFTAAFKKAFGISPQAFLEQKQFS